jgi:hypothetical protein
MSYVMLEYLLFVIVTLGFAALVFFVSLTVVLSNEALTYVFRSGRRALSSATYVSSSFGGRDGSANPPSMVRPASAAAE